MKSNFEVIIGRSIRMFRRIARLIAFALLAGATLSLSACNSGGSGAGSGGSGSVPAATMRVHYYRPDATYTNWGVYSWQGPKSPTTTGWPNTPYLFTTADGDGWGKHVDIAMDITQSQMQFLIIQTSSGNKDCSNNQQTALNSTLASTGQEIWIVSGDCTVYTQEPGKVRFSSARAVWLTSDTIVWPGASASNNYQLLVAANGGVTSSNSGVSGYDNSYALQVGSLSSTLLAKYPQYATATVLKVPVSITSSQLASLLTGEVAIVQNSIQTTGVTAVDGTQLQLAPILDSLYAATAKTATLGLSFVASVPTFSVWAPTAKSVSLNIYDTATASAPSSTAMTFDPASGIWQYTAPDATWTNVKYYTFAVKVYSRSANNAVVTNTVVDPYAVSLNALDTSSGTSVSTTLRSMVLDLAGSTATPTGWSTHALPPSLDGTDSAIYELHVRDFSANDASVAAINLGTEVGKFEAFAPVNAGVTNGMNHLAALANSGLTHVHLLPAAEFASVDEVHCSNPLITLSTGADLVAEAAVVAAQNSDCFNWGYDPIVYGVPEGSYSSKAGDGSKRVIEFRDMVMGLHSIGLRVVMDVVYNHTPASGQGDVSILDKIVPGYYYRLDGSGNVTGQSGAGSDIAAENAMTEKLVIDTLTRWADQYKVDGFRFDIMSLLPKQVLLDAQSAVNAVALVDGRSTTTIGPTCSAIPCPGIYLYGEGWSQSGLSFVNAQQSNMAGTGIGTFNDRLRDAVRGGGPFDSGASMVSNQGFVNGLCYDNNDGTACNTTTNGASLNLLQNRISVGLAGNLATFPLNLTTTGAQVDYFGGPTGYTAAPQENIAYISVHDNETVFDISQYKHPVATLAANRARAQVVGLSLVALAQGVPFFHAGDDMLRSKSMDGNSYNSGDYFNLIDWSRLKNNWAVGAPPQNTGNNANNLATMTPFLNSGLTTVGSTDINHTTLAFQDFLRLRKDTTMFRLKTANAINGCVSFPDQGAQQPGLVVMRISGAAGCGDQKYKSIVVLFNANKIAQTFTPATPVSYVGNTTVVLHPIQSGIAGSDSIVKGATFTTLTGVFSVPARTTAVFVEN
jgi:pullulanase/glycogen debranching enzyme